MKEFTGPEARKSVAPAVRPDHYPQLIRWTPGRTRENRARNDGHANEAYSPHSLGGVAAPSRKCSDSFEGRRRGGWQAAKPPLTTRSLLIDSAPIGALREHLQGRCAPLPTAPSARILGIVDARSHPALRRRGLHPGLTAG